MSPSDLTPGLRKSCAGFSIFDAAASPGLSKMAQASRAQKAREGSFAAVP
jgi:hypothetical protein